MLDVIIDTLVDSIKLFPFLLLAFLIIEIIEHRFTKKSRNLITKSGKFGPFIGSLLGAFPQCGFSVLATNLYTTRIVTLGTLISVYLSTSDEMLPILISENAKPQIIIKILGIKILIAIIAGFIIDFFFEKHTPCCNPPEPSANFCGTISGRRWAGRKAAENPKKTDGCENKKDKKETSTP